MTERKIDLAKRRWMLVQRLGDPVCMVPETVTVVESTRRCGDRASHQLYLGTGCYHNGSGESFRIFLSGNWYDDLRLFERFF